MSKNLIKERLILLSDLWGEEKSEWLTFYTSVLEQHFVLQYYDCCELGDIDKSDYSEKNLHHQFINGGIEKAVENLLQKEKESVIVLGFSIGGTIAWKAAISGLKTKSIFALSSTQLRHESEKPFGNIELFYGELDPYKPDEDWLEKMDINVNLYPNESHNMYQKKEIAELICKQMIEKAIYSI